MADWKASQLLERQASEDAEGPAVGDVGKRVRPPLPMLRVLHVLCCRSVLIRQRPPQNFERGEKKKKALDQARLTIAQLEEAGADDVAIAAFNAAARARNAELYEDAMARVAAEEAEKAQMRAERLERIAAAKAEKERVALLKQEDHDAWAEANRQRMVADKCREVRAMLVLLLVLLLVSLLMLLLLQLR